jgi:ABC-type transporter Mla subunit MlaD
VKKGTPVRIAGVNVGEVTSVRRTAETVVVKFEGGPELAKLLHSGAYARARPRIFLEGEYFLDVSPGSPQAAPLPRGSTIPGR